jgi:single-strand DNA-binding protein
MSPSLDVMPLTAASLSGASLNVVTLLGRLARPAEERLLPSGDRLLTLELSVARPGERGESVPVVWFDPPASALALDVDSAVVVVGRVRRRFFRSAGGTQSRTEVVADRVVPARQLKRVRAALADAVSRLEALAGGSAP